MLNDAGEADALVSSMQSAPTGMLRVSVATDFGSMHLSPVLGDFLAQFPDVSVNLELDNRYIEMISEGYDAAIRVGEMEDSSLRARKMRKPQFVWSQARISSTRGRPRRIEDLGAHKLLHYTNQANGAVWKMTSQTGKNVKSVQRVVYGK